MLMRYLPEAEASSASALSIRRLCDGCAPLLAASSMEPLMQLYRQIQGSGEPWSRPLHRLVLCCGLVALVQLYCRIRAGRELGRGLSTAQQLALLCDLPTCPTPCTNRGGCDVWGALNRQESPSGALPLAACRQLSSHALPHALLQVMCPRTALTWTWMRTMCSRWAAALQAATQGGALLASSDPGHLCSTLV